MRILRILPAAFSALLLGAHFLRSGDLLLVLAALALVPLAFLARPWARWTLRAALILGALEWLWTLLVLRGARVAEGAPHLRMTLILAAVAAFTALSAWWAGPVHAPVASGPDQPQRGLEGATEEA